MEHTRETQSGLPVSATQAAMQKASLLQAVTMLDGLVTAFGNAPERVKIAAKEFRDALKEWSNA